MTSVPAAVMTQWLLDAERNLEQRQEWHQRRLNTERGIHVAAHWADCWNCQRQGAICRSKRRHEAWESVLAHCADAYADDVLLVPYRCPWAEGLHWHARSAASKTDRKRARRIAERHATTTAATEDGAERVAERAGGRA